MQSNTVVFYGEFGVANTNQINGVCVCVCFSIAFEVVLIVFFLRTSYKVNIRIKCACLFICLFHFRCLYALRSTDEWIFACVIWVRLVFFSVYCVLYTVRVNFTQNHHLRPTHIYFGAAWAFFFFAAILSLTSVRLQVSLSRAHETHSKQHIRCAFRCMDVKRRFAFVLISHYQNQTLLILQRLRLKIISSRRIIEISSMNLLVNFLLCFFLSLLFVSSVLIENFSWTRLDYKICKGFCFWSAACLRFSVWNKSCNCLFFFLIKCFDIVL